MIKLIREKLKVVKISEIEEQITLKNYSDSYDFDN